MSDSFVIDIAVQLESCQFFVESFLDVRSFLYEMAQLESCHLFVAIFLVVRPFLAETDLESRFIIVVNGIHLLVEPLVILQILFLISFHD